MEVFNLASIIAASVKQVPNGTAIRLVSWMVAALEVPRMQEWVV